MVLVTLATFYVTIRLLPVIALLVRRDETMSPSSHLLVVFPLGLGMTEKVFGALSLLLLFSHPSPRVPWSPIITSTINVDHIGLRDSPVRWPLRRNRILKSIPPPRHLPCLSPVMTTHTRSLTWDCPQPSKWPQDQSAERHQHVNLLSFGDNTRPPSLDSREKRKASPARE